MVIQPFDQLDEVTEAALRASIQRFGVVVPIVVDGKNRIIDGHHRSRIAREIGVPCPQITRAVRNDDDATALAYSLNADRRMLTVEVRRQIVADLRSQGFSLRAIAGVTGASKTQVGRDVDQLSRGGQLTEPANIVGQGGRSYPASRPTAESPQLDTETSEEEGVGAGPQGPLPEGSNGPGTSSPVPPETTEQRDAREAEQRRVDRNVYFGKHLLGLWSLMASDALTDALVDGWDPTECPSFGIDATRSMFTPDGFRTLAAALDKLAAGWESRV